MGMLVILLGFMVAATTFEGFLSHGGIFNHLSLKKKCLRSSSHTGNP